MLEKWGLWPLAPRGRSGLATIARRRSEVEARGVERQSELADLHLCAVAQQGGLDADSVEVGAVERAEVAYLERRADAHELRVPARDGHVVEEDVGVGVTADGRHVGVEQEAGPDVGAAADDEQRRTRRQRGDRLLLFGEMPASRALSCATNSSVKRSVVSPAPSATACSEVRR